MSWNDWKVSATTLVLKHFHHHCHLRKRQRPEAENPKEENVESPEKDDQRVEVVVEAGEDKGLDCFAYMEGGGNGAEKIGGHLKTLKFCLMMVMMVIMVMVLFYLMIPMRRLKLVPR